MSVMEIAMRDMGQLIELANANLKVLPGPITNVSGYGAVADGVTDVTSLVQDAINETIADGRRTIFFPHGTNGQYYVTALTNADQVDFIGDNSSFVGGYTGTITNFGGLAEHFADDTLHANFLYEGKRYTITNPHKDAGEVILKGQLHSHTTNSDGVDSASALVTAYKNAGYDFISITDHDFLTPDPGIGGIVFIPGVEETNAHHVTAYDITEQSPSTDTQTVINFHRTRSKLTSIAHPNWPDAIVRKTQMQSYCDYNFVEVYNSLVDAFGENHWDWALSTGKKVLGIATDDTHNIASPQFNRGYVVVRAAGIDKASIIDALRKGHFYASRGNDIDISLDGHEITATSSASSNFTFIGYGGRVLKTANGVTSANYTIKGDEMYVRVKSTRVSDAREAWAQPIFIDSLGPDGRTNLSIVYEEGVWTPTIAGDVTQGSHTYTKQLGTYTRIGNLITVSFDVQLSSKDAAMSGASVFLRGFPANILRDKSTDITATAALWYSGIDLGTGYTSMILAWNPFNPFMTVNRTHQNKIDPITPALITANTRFLGTITYKI